MVSVLTVSLSLVAVDGPAVPVAQAAGTATAKSTATAKPSSPTLDWKSCPDAPKLQCARLRAPLDRLQPKGEGVSLAVVRLRAGKPKRRRGVLLVNPGGPGASGRLFAIQLARNPLLNRIADVYDIVGWDPRGVGQSVPIRCLDPRSYDRYFAADPTPDNGAERDALAAVSREFVKGCVSRNGAILEHVATPDTVADMELLRVALGEQRISFLGFSYGTYLGAKFADAYPSRVDRFVLDGALDPLATNESRVTLQAEGFERALASFLASCAKNCGFVSKGESPIAAFDRLSASIDAKAVVVGSGNSARLVGPGEFTTAVLAGLYNVDFGWPRLREALNRLAAGNGKPLLALFDLYADRGPNGDYRNTSDANAATNCTDIAYPASEAEYHRLAAALTKKFPRFGAFAAYSTYLCSFWPQRGPAPSAVVAKGAPPILVVGTTRDPATPYVWAKSLRNQLPGSVLLTYDSDGHTAYLTANRCIRAEVEAFLLRGKLPKSGTICRR